MSAIVAAYAETRADFLVAQRTGLKRQDIIRAMKAVARQLQGSGVLRQEALGAYMLSLIEKADPQRQGLCKRKVKKQGDQYLKDHAILGQFEIDIEDAGFESMFTGRAIRS
jgi:hypothetical protein